MDRVRTVKLVLWTICGVYFAVAVCRFTLGLGAVSALSDETPWGLWVGFDVMGGVALAAGGFVVTAIFYILKNDEFKPIVRPAVLTAFLGYAAVAIGLMHDIGLPWNIWHPMVYWQHHSALFEVAWCVMLYLTVLALEFLPVPLESIGYFAGLRKFLVKNRLILVTLGIMLSTLHQSSLGTLFVIMPHRLHPLWYSPILPVLFFVSAIALGLMMVAVESLVTHYLYRRESEIHLLSRLCGWAACVLGGWLIVRLLDLGIRGDLPALLDGTWYSKWFLVEIAISALVPIVLFTHPRTRGTYAGVGIGAFCGVFGVVLNRINVGGIAMLRTEGSGLYIPTWTEVAISAGVVSGAILVFLYLTEHFNVWQDPPKDPEEIPHKIPRFDPVVSVWLGDSVATGMKRNSLWFVIGASVSFFFLSFGSLDSQGLHRTPAEPARGSETLQIDANRDGYSVVFDHERHTQSLGEDGSCAICHHANLPEDRQTPCAECHRDVYLATSIFDHLKHQAWLGENQSCIQCHPAGENKMDSSAVPCTNCHQETQTLAVDSSPIRLGERQHIACSHTDAMHGLCVTCHKEIAERIEKPRHGLCGTCHPIDKAEDDEWNKRIRSTVSQRWVISTPLLPEKMDIERLRTAVSEVHP